MSTSPAPYPLTIRGEIDPGLGGWLWLFKWLLLIPHFIVLAVLAIIGIFAWLIAFFAILFTKRYPRGIFDYLVGVMRWSWRVSFYGYSALATDRYPPFSLQPNDDYPADLAVQYPTELSRGLVLIKWWLLAIPHYIVISFLTGSRNGGLVTLLALFGIIARLFTNEYPRGIFELVIGFNRWTYRVAAYALLMTDQYPPFRLDMQDRETPPPTV